MQRSTFLFRKRKIDLENGLLTNHWSLTNFAEYSMASTCSQGCSTLWNRMNDVTGSEKRMRRFLIDGSKAKGYCEHLQVKNSSLSSRKNELRKDFHRRKTLDAFCIQGNECAPLFCFHLSCGSFACVGLTMRVFSLVSLLYYEVIQPVLFFFVSFTLSRFI